MFHVFVAFISFYFIAHETTQNASVSVYRPHGAIEIVLLLLLLLLFGYNRLWHYDNTSSLFIKVITLTVMSRWQMRSTCPCQCRHWVTLSVYIISALYSQLLTLLTPYQRLHHRRHHLQSLDTQQRRHRRQPDTGESKSVVFTRSVLFALFIHTFQTFFHHRMVAKTCEKSV